MALLDFFLSRKKNTANIAKERLQIIVAERRRGDAEPHYLPQLRKDILEVICKYVQICLLYTSDAADDLLCVDLGGSRILKKKKKTYT